jgi:hypothetical protein
MEFYIHYTHVVDCLPCRMAQVQLASIVYMSASLWWVHALICLCTAENASRYFSKTELPLPRLWILLNAKVLSHAERQLGDSNTSSIAPLSKSGRRTKLTAGTQVYARQWSEAHVSPCRGIFCWKAYQLVEDSTKEPRCKSNWKFVARVEGTCGGAFECAYIHAHTIRVKKIDKR